MTTKTVVAAACVFGVGLTQVVWTGSTPMTAGPQERREFGEANRSNAIEHEGGQAHERESDVEDALRTASSGVVVRPGRNVGLVANQRVYARVYRTGRLEIGLLGQAPFVLERAAEDRRVLCVARGAEGEVCSDIGPEGARRVIQLVPPGGMSCLRTMFEGLRVGDPSGETPLNLLWDVCLAPHSDEVVVRQSVQGEQPGDLHVSRLVFPYAPRLSPRLQGYAVASIAQGLILPTGWITTAVGGPCPASTKGKVFHFEGNAQSRCWTMPFFGVVEGDGRALYTEVWTEMDAFLNLDQPLGDAARLSAGFWPSLETFALGGTREMAFVPLRNADYVDMALRYRHRAMATGRHMPLTAKVAARPQLQRLIGGAEMSAPAQIHIVPRPSHPAEDYIGLTFAEMQDLVKKMATEAEFPITRGVLHLDGWGQRGLDNLHPDVILPASECRPTSDPYRSSDCGPSSAVVNGRTAGGWSGLRELASFLQSGPGHEISLELHDNYRDFYLDAPSFGTGELAIRDAAGNMPMFDFWAGGKNTVLAASQARPFLRRNFDELLQHGIVPDLTYLDTFSAVDLDEDFSPSRQMTRTASARHRGSLFRELARRGISPASEEPTDWAMRDLDHVFWTTYLRHPDPSRTDLGQYGLFGFQTPVGVPVPLFELVYHDAVLTPWPPFIGDRGENSLDGWITAGLPAVDLNQLGGYPKAREEVAAMMQVNRALAMRRIVSHRFLDDRFMRQETRFDGGAALYTDRTDLSAGSRGVRGVAHRREVGGRYLVRVGVASSGLARGCVSVALHWESDDDLRRLPALLAFAHLKDSGGGIVVNRDHPPALPTTTWVSGTRFDEPAMAAICGINEVGGQQQPLPDGTYKLVAGLFNDREAGLPRLPIEASEVGDELVVGEATVSNGVITGFQSPAMRAEARLVLARMAGPREVEVMTEWLVRQPMPSGPTIFLRALQGPQVVANADYAPSPPVDQWPYGARRREERRILRFAPYQIPGTYTITTGMSGVAFAGTNADGAFVLGTLSLTGSAGWINSLRFCPSGITGCP